MRKCIARVRDWQETIGPAELTCLENAFLIGTEQVSTQQDGFFSNIYIPVKIPNENGMPEDFTYVNIGLGYDDLAQIYCDYYGLNYLVEPLDESGAFPYTDSIGKLARRIKSVLQMNKGKYLKLIELQGYSYNPLWNVDGTEEYAYLENQGVNDVSQKTKTPTITGRTNVYDGNLRDATQTSYSAVEGNYNGVTDTTYTHNNAKNGNQDYSGGQDVFGNNVVGGDKYHTEKKVRQGNIGITKTQELIESERENLKFSLIQEFFNDINEQILIGVY